MDDTIAYRCALSDFGLRALAGDMHCVLGHKTLNPHSASLYPGLEMSDREFLSHPVFEKQPSL